MTYDEAKTKRGLVHRPEWIKGVAVRFEHGEPVHWYLDGRYGYPRGLLTADDKSASDWKFWNTVDQ